MKTIYKTIASLTVNNQLPPTPLIISIYPQLFQHRAQLVSQHTFPIPKSRISRTFLLWRHVGGCAAASATAASKEQNPSALPWRWPGSLFSQSEKGPFSWPYSSPLPPNAVPDCCCSSPWCNSPQPTHTSKCAWTAAAAATYTLLVEGLSTGGVGVWHRPPTNPHPTASRWQGGRFRELPRKMFDCFRRGHFWWQIWLDQPATNHYGKGVFDCWFVSFKR